MGSKHAILLAAGVLWTSAGFGASDPARVQPHTGSAQAGEAAAPKHRFRWPIIGRASWYGHDFQGKKTASGERYNMYEMTAASKTLPLGSYAKVTNLKNRRWVLVKINDRGPYVGDRILDLSYSAAKALSLTKQGVEKVAIQPLAESETSTMAMLETP
jgi:rare lipoprotein A (peptidoglycan hydrolase)